VPVLLKNRGTDTRRFAGREKKSAPFLCVGVSFVRRPAACVLQYVPIRITTWHSTLTYVWSWLTDVRF